MYTHRGPAPTGEWHELWEVPGPMPCGANDPGVCLSVLPSHGVTRGRPRMNWDGMNSTKATWRKVPPLNTLKSPSLHKTSRGKWRNKKKESSTCWVVCFAVGVWELCLLFVRIFWVGKIESQKHKEINTVRTCRIILHHVIQVYNKIIKGEMLKK